MPDGLLGLVFEKTFLKNIFDKIPPPPKKKPAAENSQKKILKALRILRIFLRILGFCSKAKNCLFLQK